MHISDWEMIYIHLCESVKQTSQCWRLHSPLGSPVSLSRWWSALQPLSPLAGRSHWGPRWWPFVCSWGRARLVASCSCPVKQEAQARFCLAVWWWRQRCDSSIPAQSEVLPLDLVQWVVASLGLSARRAEERGCGEGGGDPGDRGNQARCWVPRVLAAQWTPLDLCWSGGAPFIHIAVKCWHSLHFWFYLFHRCFVSE